MKHLIAPFTAIIALIFTIFSFFSFNYLSEKTTVNNTLNNAEKTAFSASKGTAVLELFTSEGCSSCPPADDVLRGLAIDSNVIALSFHVTYWNRLGWTDSFSQKKFDERQYAYGEKFHASGVYTPQAVINGLAEMVGSKKSQVTQAVKNALETPSKVTISLKKSVKDGDIEVNYKLLGDVPKDAILQFALVESAFATKVKRGENEGRTLKHDNVVRDFETRQAADTEGSVAFFPLSGWQVKNCTVVAFVQEKGLGKILGAAKLNIQ